MHKYLLGILFFFSIVVNAQFAGTIFKSEYGRTISFIDSNHFVSNLWQGGEMKHYIGRGTYSIIGNKLIAELRPYAHKDTAILCELKQDSESDSIFIECKYQIDSTLYSCESMNYWITSNITQISKAKMINTNSKISIPKNDITENTIIHFSNLNTKYYFPIKSNTNYIVILKRNDFEYLESGKFVFKIIKKKNNVILRLINGKDYVDNKNSKFYPYLTSK